MPLNEQEEFELLSLERDRAKGKAPKRDIAAEIANDPISRGAREAMHPQGVMETAGRWFYGDPNATVPERIAANPMTRFAMGAASPILGTAQLIGNLSSRQGKIENDSIDQLERMKRAGGMEGADVSGIAGQMLSPVALKAATLLGNAPTTAGRIWQGATMGAGFGAASPVENAGDNYWGNKAGQVGIGAVAGGAIPAAWEGAKAVGAGIRNVAQPYLGQSGADRAAGRLLNDAAGARRAAILQELDKSAPIVPGSNLTAGQAAIPAGSAEFSALQKIASERDPSTYAAINNAQNQARAIAIRSFAGDENALNKAIANRAAVTTPMRETALANANLAGVKGPQLAERLAAQNEAKVSALQDVGRFQTMAAQQENLAGGGSITPNIMGVSKSGSPYVVQGAGGSGNVSASAYPVMGQPRIPPRYTENIQRVPEAQSAAADTAEILAKRKAQEGLTQYQLDSLAAHGQFPLEGKQVASQIDAVMSQPGKRSSDVVTKALGEIRDKINQFSNQNGVIDSRDLYTIRKEAGNVVKKYAAENKNWDEKLTSGLTTNVQKMIDDAIEGAGGAGWKDYLGKYVGMSKDINQMQIGQELLNRLQPALEGAPNQRATMFANALKDSANTVQKAGVPRYASVKEALTPENMAKVNSVQADLARNAAFEDMATRGLPSASRAVNLAAPEIGSVGMFSPKISVARSIYNRVTGHATDKILNDLAARMTDPAKTAEIMRKATPYERKLMVDLLMKQQAAIPVALTEGQSQ